MHEDPTRMMRQPDDDDHRPHGNTRLLIAGLIAVIVGLIVAVVVIASSGDSGSSTSTVTTAAERNRLDHRDDAPARPPRPRLRPRPKRRRPRKRRRRPKKRPRPRPPPEEENGSGGIGAPVVAPGSPADVRTASYEADPAEVRRVLLLYSGGLDTSVMLKWIQDSYDAEVVCLTVNLGQPGEDYAVIEDKAKRLGALECHVVDAREEFAADYVLPAIKANALYGGGYPLFTALGRPLIAKLAVEYARRQRLRHDRPRLHRQGQRPGADRGHGGDPGAGAEDDRPGALLADGPRGGDRLRPRARHPGQGRHRGGALLDRRQPLGPLLGGSLDRGSRPRARGRRLPAGHPPGGGARRGRDR